MRPFLLIVLSSLACCATAAQRQADTIKAELGTAAATVKNCTTLVYKNLDYATITAYLPYNAMQASILQISNRARLPISDVPLYSRTHDEMGLCSREFLQKISLAVPLAVHSLTEAYTALDQNSLALDQQSISFGEFVTRAKAVGEKSKIEFRKNLQQADANL